jgi:hypothetical protein
MTPEDTDAMTELDARLRQTFRSLDTSPGFEARLQRRLASLSGAPGAPSPAELRARLEREHDRARRAAAHAAQVDGAAVAIAGVGGLVAAWHFAPGLLQLYWASVQESGPAAVGFITLAAAAGALWTVLRRCGVSPRTLLGA